MSDTPIYDELVEEHRIARLREAQEASPGVIGFGQWEKCGGPCCGGDDPPEGIRIRPTRRTRKR